jgi:hypothetical protein
VAGRDPAGILGALQRLAAHLDPAGGGMHAQDRGLGAAHEAQVHAAVSGGGVRRDVLVPLDEADLIPRLYVLRVNTCHNG